MASRKGFCLSPPSVHDREVPTGQQQVAEVSEAGSKEEGEGDVVDVDQKNQKLLFQAVQEFMESLRKQVLTSIGGGGDASSGPLHHSSSLPIPVELFKSLCQFIWEPNVIYTRKGFLRRTYNTLNYSFNEEATGSDFQNLMDYRPSLLLTEKATQVFIALVLPDPDLFAKELENYKKILEDERVEKDSHASAGYTFVYNVLKLLFDVLAKRVGDEEELEALMKAEETDFSNLSLHSKCVVHAMSTMFVKTFRTKAQERIVRIKKVIEQDEGNVEWYLAKTDMDKVKRRAESSKNKWNSLDEITYLEKARAVDPNNPYLRLAVLDTIVGSVRESSGRLKCGDIELFSREEAMRYLYEHTEKLNKEYPNNVMFLSVVADYFTRCFPYLYMNADKSVRLLQKAYELDPSNPKTTHRSGIVWRMSYANCDESLKWLAETIALDETHYSGTIEYYKTILGKLDDFDVAKRMTETWESPAAAGFLPHEKAEFAFYWGIAHFARGNKEKALECWKRCLKAGETFFTLEDMLVSSGNFCWDTKLLNIDSIKTWIMQEKKTIEERKKHSYETGDKDLENLIYKVYSLSLGFSLPTNFRGSDVFPRRFPNSLLPMLDIELI